MLTKLLQCQINKTGEIMKKTIVYLLMWAFVIVSCSDDNPSTPVVEENQYLVNYELVRNYSLTDLTDIFESVLVFIPSPDYGVKVYKIEYKTKNIDGSDITASGVIVVPDEETNGAMVSYQHGTIFMNSDAPSVFYENSFLDEGSLIASYGFICVIPDYLGYGVTQNMLHPYQHAASLGKTTSDLIHAGNEFLKEIQWQQRSELFLTGYSEGGYATIATLKELEENSPDEYDIIGVSAGAGAYNMVRTANDFMNYDDSIEHPEYLCFVIWAYNGIYNLGKPAIYYFNEPYASKIENGLLKGEYGDEGFDSLPKDKTELLSQEFMDDYNNGDFPEFLAALEDNNLYEYIPQAKVKLYHGTSDKDVFYQNSEDFYNYAKANGADIELHTLPLRTHITAAADWTYHTFNWLMSLKPE